MSAPGLQISVVMPGLNEQENIALAIDSAIAAFKELGIRAELVVIDDGSTDGTTEIMRCKCSEYAGLVRMIRHETPKGIGASFWDGVDHAVGQAVVLLPADNEIDPRQILRYLSLIEQVDMVVPFAVNPRVRPAGRRILSRIFTCIINATFATSFHYTNGTVIYRRAILLTAPYRVNDFFFQTDILVHLAQKKYLFAEVPYLLHQRTGGSSKALSLKSLCTVARGYVRLAIDIYTH
jgi:glycosyltransferase involved in cell wall biosynthesis